MNRELKLTRIGRTKVVGALGLVVFLMAVTAVKAPAQTILIDDFNDRNDDGWRHGSLEGPIGPAIFDTSSRAYRLTSAGALWNLEDVRNTDTEFSTSWDASHSNPLLYSHGIFRFRFRIDGNATRLQLHMRSQEVNPGVWSLYSFYMAALPGEGRSAFLFHRQKAGVQTKNEFLQFGAPRLHEEWMLEAGAIGDRITMKWWPVGGPEPIDPQFTWIDPDPLPPGVFGMVVGVPANVIEATGTPPPWRIDATVDNLYFTFPEHDDVYTVSPYNIYLWDSPMPVPQQEGPYFVADSPEKPDMRADVAKVEGWPDLHLAGQVTDVVGRPIPGLQLDFWQADDRGSYDNSGGYALRGHVYTDSEGNYELWTVIPAAYETIRTRHLHLRIGGANLGFSSPVYTTQLYFPAPYDNDLDADGTPDKVVQGGFETEFDAIALEDDFITLGDLEVVGAEFSDLVGNILTIDNDAAVDGYFDAALNIVMPEVFQSPEMAKRILIDDFNDGNDDGWDHDDGIADQPFGPAIYDASSGAYRLASAGPLGEPQELRESGGFSAAWAASSSDPLFYSHGLFRFRFRIDGSGTSFEFAMRAKEVGVDTWSFYAFGADSVAGRPGAFSFRRVQAGVSEHELVEIDPSPPYLYQEEWMLEAGAIGDRLTMKWWPVGAPEPNDPQWEWLDPDPLPPGIFGTILYLSTGAIEDHNVPPPWRIDATIDDIYFTPSDVEDSPRGRR